ALATTATTATGVGSYAITQGTVTNANNTNYAIAYTSGTLTVAVRDITVTADNKTRKYGNANPALTWTVGGDGLVNGDTLTGALATTATTATGVGSYAITQGTVTNANNTNYAIAYTSGTLTVAVRDITVTADNKTRKYGNANPALTWTVGGDGLVNGDTLTGALATTATTATG
ncbi:MAG: hypothetical protein AN484_28665, partial [Aphanizomenon flos-aquae WA102]